MLCLYYLYIHSYLNYTNTALCSTNRTYLKKLQSQQKHTIRIIFHEDKFAHTREHFKENNILHIYQLTIFNNLLFLHRVKSGKTPNVFLSKFLRPSHHYSTSFSQNNCCTLLSANKKQVQNNDTSSEVMECFYTKIKGTLTQIWKFHYMPGSMWKFRILKPKNFWAIYPWIWTFLKK